MPNQLTGQHRRDKRKSFVFPRQHRNYFSQRINTLVPRNEPIKTAMDARFS